jgi:hypothetical protein
MSIRFMWPHHTWIGLETQVTSLVRVEVRQPSIVRSYLLRRRVWGPDRARELHWAITEPPGKRVVAIAQATDGASENYLH